LKRPADGIHSICPVPDRSCAENIGMESEEVREEEKEAAMSGSVDDGPSR
jgi:hypothetical protein